MSNLSRWRIYNRRFLVDPFQLRLMAVAAFHFVLVVLVFVSALFAPVVIRLADGDISSPHVQAAAREFLLLHTRLWAPLLGAFALLILHNLLVTHRVAGPLFRFRRYFKAVGDGELSSPIEIRQGDYLQTHAKAINDMVASLRDKITHLQGQLQEANRAWMNLRNVLPETDELGRRINAVDRGLEGCRDGLKAFKSAKPIHPKSPATASAERVEIKT